MIVKSRHVGVHLQWSQQLGEEGKVLVSLNERISVSDKQKEIGGSCWLVWTISLSG